MHVTCTGLHVDVLEGEDLRHEDWFGKWNTEFVMRFEAEKTGSKVYLHKITNAVRSFDSEYEWIGKLCEHHNGKVVPEFVDPGTWKVLSRGEEAITWVESEQDIKNVSHVFVDFKCSFP